MERRDAPFPALSILTILLDKCQTKSFEDEHFDQTNFQVLYHTNQLLKNIFPEGKFFQLFFGHK